MVLKPAKNIRKHLTGTSFLKRNVVQWVQSEWSFAEYVYYLHADIMYVHVGCIKYYDLLYAFDDFA